MSVRLLEFFFVSRSNPLRLDIYTEYCDNINYSVIPHYSVGPLWTMIKAYLGPN